MILKFVFFGLAIVSMIGFGVSLLSFTEAVIKNQSNYYAYISIASLFFVGLFMTLGSDLDKSPSLTQRKSGKTKLRS